VREDRDAERQRGIRRQRCREAERNKQTEMQRGRQEWGEWNGMLINRIILQFCGTKVFTSENVDGC